MSAPVVHGGDLAAFRRALAQKDRFGRALDPRRFTIDLRWSDLGVAYPMLSEIIPPFDDDDEGEIVPSVYGQHGLGDAALLAENAVEDAARELGVRPLSAARCEVQS